MSTADSSQLAATTAGFSSVSIGKKVLMAITGATWVGFVIGHLLGNLQVFLGQEQLNHYAETLQNLGAVKWVFRAFIAGFLLVHIWKGIALWWENRVARPIGYTRSDTIQATIASRTMIYTGALILLFVIYHLLHFTILAVDPAYQNLPPDSAGRFDVYSMVILGFSKPAISAVYIAAMVCLGFHLSHAMSSFLQTLGLSNQETLPKLKAMATGIAVLIAAAYVTIPVAVLTGLIQLSGGGN